MFVASYSYSASYFDFYSAGELPDEGVLQGDQGKFGFKRIQDGFAIYDSTLTNTGFVYPGLPDDVYVPHTLNGIPVTEVHLTFFPKPKLSFTIENGGLKRVFIKIGKQYLDQRIRYINNDTRSLLKYCFYLQEYAEQKNPSTQVYFDFCGNHSNQVEFCSITCDDRLILHVPPARVVEVNAHRTDLGGGIPDCVEKIVFSGKIYPVMERGWDLDEPNNHCFDGLKNLRTAEGSFSGDMGWSFRNCASLERIHLSNGIKEIPSYAFSKCSSLKDLYIPDTVLKIGPYAFNGCSNLVSIHLPANLKRIAEGTFNGCRALKKVYLSDTIEIIEDYAFAGCISLRKPWIPKNIKSISETAFNALEQA